MQTRSVMKQAWAVLLLTILAAGVTPAAVGSDEDFLLFMPAIIAGPWISMTAPNGGEILTAGTSYVITWKSSPRVKKVDIELSKDSGANYPFILAKGIDNEASHGSHTWGPVGFYDTASLGDTFRIRIRDSEHSSAMSQSKKDFSIEPSLPLNLGDLEGFNNNPSEIDSDGDNLCDKVEIYLGADPFNWDSDRDGIEHTFRICLPGIKAILSYNFFAFNRLISVFLRDISTLLWYPKMDECGYRQTQFK